MFFIARFSIHGLSCRRATRHVDNEVVVSSAYTLCFQKKYTKSRVQNFGKNIFEISANMAVRPVASIRDKEKKENKKGECSIQSNDVISYLSQLL